MYIIAAAFFTTLLLFFQANHPIWIPHLQTDVIIHWQQAIYFFENLSWVGISFNEYQPGALWFFLLPHILSGLEANYEVYKQATILLNALLLVAHGYIYQKYGPRNSLFMFTILLIAFGPILLYRFDLVATLLTLVAWLLLQNKKLNWSAFTLGLASAIKIYPILLTPFIGIPFLLKKKLKEPTLAGLSFLAGVAAPTIPYLLLFGSFASLQDSFAKYAIKPVSLESLWGSLLIPLTKIADKSLSLGSQHGIHGIYPPSTIFTLDFYNQFWIIPTLITIGLLIYAQPKKTWLTPTITIATFVLFAKVINPQYLWWFLVFIPLIPNTALIVTSAIALTLTQIIYPIFYTEHLEWFYQSNSNPTLFIISIVRNILLVYLLVFLWVMTKKRTS